MRSYFIFLIFLVTGAFLEERPEDKIDLKELEKKIDVQALLKAAKEKKKKDDDLLEYTKIEDYTNVRLYACSLLAECKIVNEEVYI